MKKQVIMQVLPALGPGGVETGTVEIASALQKKGISNLVVSSGGVKVAQLKNLGVEHITLPMATKNPFILWLNALKLAKIIKQKKVTLMHVRSRAPAWSVKWASKKTGVPFIATFHGVYGLSPRWLKQRYNRVMVQGKEVIAVSTHVKKHIMENYDVPSDKITVIHRGADTHRFDLSKVSMEKVMSLFNKDQVSLGKPVIMMVGRLTRWKGQLTLLEALSLMKHKDVSCLFIGSDQGRTDYTREMKEKIDKLPPQTEVKIIEDNAVGAERYMMSDIFVSASLQPEAFGRVIPEAQAMGRIVVASAHGGACETVEDGVSGFLVPVGDAKALAQKLDAILALKLTERKKIQNAGIESVQARFSIDKMCQKTLAIYERYAK